MAKNVFAAEYQKLNKAQKEAVDTIEGPVMVVAGPGTGKTQVLSLRIAYILESTDTGASGILALTFTKAAVAEMEKRLVAYIGEDGNKVNISTFHSFGMKIVEKYYELLKLDAVPKLLDDTDTAVIFDEVLELNDWRHLRPRSDRTRYFSDLRSLISLLKRERVTGRNFLVEVEKEIKLQSEDQDNISTRGESKGQLKKEALAKIEGLERSREVAKFYELYEEAKKRQNVFDYDDVLENLVKITEISPDAVADIQEKYLYVLVDEHQDSSRVQNEFLEHVWGEVESPNIFVVGDDRQLIYGFSGASIDHFAGFAKTFKEAKLITLTDNYRSTQVILDASHALLESAISKEKLVSHHKENHPLWLLETEHPEDEIIACALDIKDKIKNGVNPNDCAILVPKNAQVRKALDILHGMGLPVSSLDALNLFDQAEALAFLRVLKIISGPGDSPSLALSFFDTLSGIPPLEAHTYLASRKMREFSFASLVEDSRQTLFGAESPVEVWINKLIKWSEAAKEEDALSLVKAMGGELLLAGSSGGKLVSGQEILDTVLDLAGKEIEKNPNLSLAELVAYFSRLESYGEKVPLVLPAKEGIKVLTLHSSKGLEFDYVWIAHMDERSLESGKRMGFALPESIAERVEERDADRAKRKLYVAITRAKRFCTISYALYSKNDSEQEVAKIIADLPEEILQKKKGEVLEKKVKTQKDSKIKELTKLVAQKYSDRYVSASLLNNFFECPWKWYFRNILQMPEPEAEVLLFGSAVHACVDQLLKMGDIPDDKEIREIISGAVSVIGLDPRSQERMMAEVWNVVLPWAKNRLPEIKLRRVSEEGISVKDKNFPHLKIFGKIDLIEWLDGENVRITDFKTGSGKRKSEIEKLDEEGRLSTLMRQLAMYSYLLKESPKWNKLDPRESRLEFLEAKNKKEAFYNKVLGAEELELLRRDIEDYDELVKSGKWTERPCNYNSYGKNTECEYCQMAEIYK